MWSYLGISYLPCHVRNVMDKATGKHGILPEQKKNCDKRVPPLFVHHESELTIPTVYWMVAFSHTNDMLIVNFPWCHCYLFPFDLHVNDDDDDDNSAQWNIQSDYIEYVVSCVTCAVASAKSMFSFKKINCHEMEIVAQLKI